jgi:hypothetical protein
MGGGNERRKKVGRKGWFGWISIRGDWMGIDTEEVRDGISATRYLA